MGILNFEKLPASTLIGADSSTIKRVLEGVEYEKEYRSKIRLTKCIQSLLAEVLYDTPRLGGDAILR